MYRSVLLPLSYLFMTGPREVFGVLKLPFINFAYNENGKGAAQVLLEVQDSYYTDSGYLQKGKR